MKSRLEEKFIVDVIPALQEKFNIKNVMQVPRMRKIVVNMGVGEAISDMKILDKVVEDLKSIVGQKPIITRAKVAISNFKLREGMPIGCKVTLRRARMYEFLDRLVNVSLPRIRDFNGVSNKAFDKQGNYTLGLSEQAIFPEIDTGAIQHTQGMDITIVLSNSTKEKTKEVLRLLGVPFRKN